VIRKNPIIKTRKEFYPFDIKKYLTLKNALILLILAFLYLMFPKYIQAVVLMFIFYPISVFTVRTTKYMRGMGIETITPFTLFLSYLYGWEIALFFGFGIGTYIWSQAGMNQKTMAQCLMNAFCAFIGIWMRHTFPAWTFATAYVVAVMIRNVLTYLIFIPVNPDKVGNLTHFLSDIAWNTIILTSVMSFMYDIVMLVTVR
jgi:hypothetical protein